MIKPTIKVQNTQCQKTSKIVKLHSLYYLRWLFLFQVTMELVIN
jgi:hypothetical protein